MTDVAQTPPLRTSTSSLILFGIVSLAITVLEFVGFNWLMGKPWLSALSICAASLFIYFRNVKNEVLIAASMAVSCLGTTSVLLFWSMQEFALGQVRWIVPFLAANGLLLVLRLTYNGAEAAITALPEGETKKGYAVFGLLYVMTVAVFLLLGVL